MDQLTGRVSNTSPPTSWDGSDRHDGKHFTLLVFPDGRLILACPDNLDRHEFDQIQVLMGDWLHAETPYPLVIGNCRVALSMVAAASIEYHA